MNLILGSAPFSDLLLCGNLTTRAALQEDSKDVSCSRSCEEEAHLVCSQLVLQHRPKHFTWSLQQRQSDEAPDVRLPCAMEAVVDIDLELLQRLPLLASISEDIGQQNNRANGEYIVSAGCSFCGHNIAVVLPKALRTAFVMVHLYHSRVSE